MVQPLGTQILGGLPTGWHRPGLVSDEMSEPMIAVIAIKFESGHKNVMTDKGFYNPDRKPASIASIEKDFEPGGVPFPDWQWQRYSASSREYSYPVSHTRNERITLTVMIDNKGPAVKGRVVGKVLGTDVAASMRFEKSITFDEGVTEHQIDSDTKIRDAIFSASFRVDWEIIGPEIAPAIVLFPRKRTLAWNRIVTSDNEILVTAGPPIPTGSELTYARLAHSVKMISATGAKETRKIVEKLVIGLEPRFGPGPAPTWAMAFSETSGGDCASQADYIVSMLKMIGAPGTVKAVILYVRPKGEVRWKMIDPAGEKVFKDFHSPPSAFVVRMLDDHDSMEFTIIEEDAPKAGVPAGLAKPQIQNHTGEWRLRLIGRRSGGPNVYEGCVKVVGAEKYNAAGTPYGELEKERVIPTVFRSVAWYDYGANETKKALKSYP